MAGEILLDTNVIIAFMKQDANVVRRLDLMIEVFVPSIVMGELYYGAYKSRMVQMNLNQFNAFAADATILDCDIATADHYGAIKAELEKKGRAIPDNDIWIAALCQQYQLPLATRDQHFQHCDGLNVEFW